jgi:hypothetical protein
MKYLKTFESYNNIELIDEGMMNDIFSKIMSKFKGKEDQLKDEIEVKLGLDETSSKEEVEQSVKELLDGETNKEKLLRIARRVGGILGLLLEWTIYLYIYWNYGDFLLVKVAFVIFFIIRYGYKGKSETH